MHKFGIHHNSYNNHGHPWKGWANNNLLAKSFLLWFVLQNGFQKTLHEIHTKHMRFHPFQWFITKYHPCCNPTLKELWGCHSHSQKWDLGVLRDSQKFRARLQGSKHLVLRLFCTIGKVLNFRCPKWPRMSHLDIFSTSYGRKKGRESNCQFDSQPLKVGNRPDSGACKWSATHCWKAFEESYNFGLDLVPIRVQGEKLRASKVPGVQTGTVSGFHFGSPGKKSHLDASAAESCR